MSEISFEHKGSPKIIHVCQICYLITLNSGCLEAFRDSHTEFAPAPASQNKSLIRLLDRGLIDHGKTLLTIFNNFTKSLINGNLSLIRVSVIISIGALAVSLFSSLLPFTWAKALRSAGPGSLESSIILSLLSHLDLFHLLPNLFFLLSLGSVAEKRWGSARFAALLTAGVWSSFVMSSIVTPKAFSLGLSPAIATCFGLLCALNPAGRIRIWPGTHYSVPLPQLGAVFLAFEFRTLIPNTEIPTWNSLPHSFIAFTVSVAIATTILQARLRQEKISRQSFRTSSVLAPSSRKATAPLRKSG